MKLIADAFNKRFAHWKIKLPEENLKNGQSGYIQQAGRLIQYCFGEDENGEYMDYYAAHRMTDDSHLRIYADGREKALPTLNGRVLYSEDPVEAKRLEKSMMHATVKWWRCWLRRGSPSSQSTCASVGWIKKTKK